MSSARQYLRFVGKGSVRRGPGQGLSPGAKDSTVVMSLAKVPVKGGKGEIKGIKKSASGKISWYLETTKMWGDKKKEGSNR